jgi:hypothetical protein
MTMKSLRTLIAGLTALIAGTLSQFADAALLQMGDDLGPAGIEYNSSSNSVEIDFELTNNDSGTEYVQFGLNSFIPLIQDIHNFGNNSTTYATIGDMINGTTGSENNFDLVLDPNPSYVNSGWLLILNNDGSIIIDEDNAVPSFLRDTWEDTTTSPSADNTARGTLSINAGLLDANGVAADYFMNPLGTPSDNGDLNLFQSATTYQADHGSPAGVAETSGGSFPTADNTYVQTAVIPEPGTLALTLLAGLIPLSVQLSRTVRRRRR